MIQFQRKWKLKKTLSDEYDLTTSSLDRWLHQYEKVPSKRKITVTRTGGAFNASQRAGATADGE
ncbi:hypothetical protein [Peribacillus simplex]|uniref:hypothetical protein n=1 Tax=Peribacillus simplex TaxID=1478 RepID=UPI003D2C67FC